MKGMVQQHTGKRHEALILCLETPLEDSDIKFSWERLLGLLHADDGLCVEKILVDIGVRLHREKMKKA